MSLDCENHFEHEDFKGPEEWDKKFLDLFFQASPDVRTKINDIVADGDTIVMNRSDQGNFITDFFGIQPTGKKFEYSGISWGKFQNGKLVETWNNWIMSFLFRQLLSEVKELRAILPMCSFCKRIRNDDGCWDQVEAYLHKYANVDISHSLCRDCFKKEYPDIYLETKITEREIIGAGKKADY